MTTLAPAWRYMSLTPGNSRSPDPSTLFEAMKEDLISDGDVERAMQKAFRWGYEDEDGDHIDGLRDIMKRLREDREELLADETDDSTPGSGDATSEVDTEPADDAGEGERLD